MEVNILSVSPISTNCYVLVNERKSAVVIDPGGSFPHIKSYLDKNGLIVKAILLTHGHFDHIGAVPMLKEYSDAPIYIHADDNEMLESAEKSLAFHFIEKEDFIKTTADKLVWDGDKLNIDGMEFTVIHTKGHTKGSCVYLCDEYMFSGDTLFRNGYGRTDLYGGSESDIKKSLLRLASLEGDYVVFPGHGSASELAYEKLTNPMMGGSYDDIF